MEIEDTVEREKYRDYDLVHLRRGTADQTRWQITHKESGMNRSYGYAPTQAQARGVVDALLKVGRD